MLAPLWALPVAGGSVVGGLGGLRCCSLLGMYRKGAAWVGSFGLGWHDMPRVAAKRLGF